MYTCRVSGDGCSFNLGVRPRSRILNDPDGWMDGWMKNDWLFTDVYLLTINLLNKSCSLCDCLLEGSNGIILGGLFLATEPKLPTRKQNRAKET